METKQKLYTTVHYNSLFGHDAPKSLIETIEECAKRRRVKSGKSKFSFVVLYDSSVFCIGLRNRTVLLSHTHSSYSGCIKEMFPVLQKTNQELEYALYVLSHFLHFLIRPLIATWLSQRHIPKII